MRCGADVPGTVSRETRPLRIAVVGTGTAVGKTHATRALAIAAVRFGHDVAALKPIESGVASAATDYAALARAGNVHVSPAPYAFPDPVSPHLAARNVGVRLNLARVLRWVDAHEADWTFVETAGALLSPLSARETNLDLVLALRCHAIVLVAPDRLGVLHDVSACRLVLASRLPALPTLTVLQAPARADSSTGTNARELARLRIARPVVALPRSPNPASTSVQSAANHALAVLRRLAVAPARPA